MPAAQCAVVSREGGNDEFRSRLVCVHPLRGDVQAPTANEAAAQHGSLTWPHPDLRWSGAKPGPVFRL